MYETVLSRSEPRWLHDHHVFGQVVVPGAAVAELVHAAAEHRFEGQPSEVFSLVLLTPLVLPERGGQRVQVIVTDDDERTEVTVYSQLADAVAGAEWTRHASAEVRRASEVRKAQLDVGSLRSRCSELVDVDGAYEAYASVGLEYGPAFRGLRRLYRGEGEALAEVVLPEGVEGADTYGVHPALLDAAFQATTGVSVSEGLSLPFALDRMTVYQSGATTAMVYVRSHDSTVDDDALAVDVTLTDEQGQVLAEVSGLRSRPADVETNQRHRTKNASDALYRVEWPEAALPTSEGMLPTGRWLVVADEGDALAEALAARLRHRGAECVRVQGPRLEEELPAEHVVCVWGAKGDREQAAEGRCGWPVKVW